QGGAVFGQAARGGLGDSLRLARRSSGRFPCAAGDRLRYVCTRDSVQWGRSQDQSGRGEPVVSRDANGPQRTKRPKGDTSITKLGENGRGRNPQKGRGAFPHCLAAYPGFPNLVSISD